MPYSLEKSIHEIMEANKIREYDISYALSAINYQKYLCSVGSPIGIQSISSKEDKFSYGSVSGCVTRQNDQDNGEASFNGEDKKQHLIIFSGHVATHLRGEVRIANAPIEFKETSLLKCDQKADLAALAIEKEFLKQIKFDFKFKTAEGEERVAKVFNFDDEQLSETEFPFSLEVYCRGASTKLGKGIMTSNDIRSANSPCHYILIEDVEMDEPFCKPGDSGSMVCHFNPNNDHIDLLAMVQGKLQQIEKTYIAVKLKFGLDLFSEAHGHVELCDNIYKTSYELCFIHFVYFCISCYIDKKDLKCSFRSKPSLLCV